MIGQPGDPNQPGGYRPPVPPVPPRPTSTASTARADPPPRYLCGTPSMSIGPTVSVLVVTSGVT
jgi:hypothetical protein